MLSDLEICKRVAEIEALNYVEINDTIFISKGYSCDIKFNPLTDDALAFRLMIKYKLELEYYEDHISAYNEMINYCEHCAETANKAICLALIETDTSKTIGTSDVLTFGKYKGYTFKEVLEKDHSYIEWAIRKGITEIIMYSKTGEDINAESTTVYRETNDGSVSSALDCMGDMIPCEIDSMGGGSPHPYITGPP